MTSTFRRREGDRFRLFVPDGSPALSRLAAIASIAGPSIGLTQEHIGTAAGLGGAFAALRTLRRCRRQLRGDEHGIDLESFQPFDQAVERLDWQRQAAMTDFHLAERRIEGAGDHGHLLVDRADKPDEAGLGADVVPSVNLLQVGDGGLPRNRFEPAFEGRVTPGDFECARPRRASVTACAADGQSDGRNVPLLRNDFQHRPRAPRRSKRARQI